MEFKLEVWLKGYNAHREEVEKELEDDKEQ